MKLKPAPLDIPAKDPFKNDVLGRKLLAESLTTLLANASPPFVLCIDAPWGTGKTTFLRLWKSHLEMSGSKVVYFNAWETDFAEDPLVAFVSEISDLAASSGSRVDKSIDRLRNVGSKIAKRAIPVAIKLATAGLIHQDDLTEESVSGLAADLTGDAIQAYDTQRKLSEQFRSLVADVVGKLPAPHGDPRLLILVDELDRCRPSYAIELLERIKHLFNAPNVVFALALDKRQLRASVEALYGSRIDSEDYLRRFIDLEISLPRPSKQETFTDYLFGQFEFVEIFQRRKHQAFQYDVDHLKSTFNALARVFSLSLRTQEQCFTRLRVALMATPDDHYIYPDLLVSLVVLRATAPDLYQRFVAGSASVTDILAHIRIPPSGAEFLDSHEGMLLEAFLIAAKQTVSENVPELAAHQAITQSDAKTEPEKKLKQRSETLLSFLQEMRVRRQTPPLAYVASKIELGTDRK